AAEEIAVGELLQVVEPGGDAPVARFVEGEKVDARSPVATRIELGRVDDWVELGVNHTRLNFAGGVDEVVPLVSRIVGSVGVAVPQRRLKVGRHLAAPHGEPLSLRGLNRPLDLGEGRLVRLGNQNRNAVLRLLAILNGPRFEY